MMKAGAAAEYTWVRTLGSYLPASVRGPQVRKEKECQNLST